MGRLDLQLNLQQARNIWLRAQRLDERTPFGAGSEAVLAAIEHLGYVQIDTINVIERAHHHILWSRIPDYKISDLEKLQSEEKKIFECWTHALSYAPTKDFPHFISEMKEFVQRDSRWFASVTKEEIKKIMRQIRNHGAVSIRDMKDEKLIEKDHEWASRKPSKKVLSYLFHAGRLTVSKRSGMLKHYDLSDRHFNWEKFPKPSTTTSRLNYLIDRSLKSQGIISLDSVTYLKPKLKSDIQKVINRKVKQKEIISVALEGDSKNQYWMRPDTKDAAFEPLIHILSPFDPLVIQRKRLKIFFDYEHIFEAYVPKVKRKFGYFTLPVLYGDKVVALLDLKTDRLERKVRIQRWIWREKFKSLHLKQLIESELDRFEAFQLSDH